MPCCKKLLRALLCFALPLCLVVTAVFAASIEPNKAEMRQSEEGYQLTADFTIRPNYEVQHALSLGVPLYFVSEFSLTRSRWYWLDEQVFQNDHTVKLSYNVLTRQYRISRGSLLQNFASMDDMFRNLAHQSSVPIPADVMKKDGNYVAAVRLRLDTGQLPKLMQVNVLTSKDWDMDSGWYRLLIHAVGGVVRNPRGAE